MWSKYFNDHCFSDENGRVAKPFFANFSILRIVILENDIKWSFKTNEEEEKTQVDELDPSDY